MHVLTDASTRIVVVDDHPPLRRGLIQLLQTLPRFRLVGEASCGKDGIAEGTVKVHVKLLLRKPNPRSRVEAAVWAVERLPRATKAIKRKSGRFAAIPAATPPSSARARVSRKPRHEWRVERD